MAVRTFRLPDLGEGIQEAEIVEWHVSQDSRVVADQPLVSVETDKAVVEVPSPWSGRVTRLHAAPGDVLATGAPLADIDDKRATDEGAIVGSLERTDVATGTVDPAAERDNAAVERVRAAPAARARARDLGVDLSRVIGSGPGGSISVADVEATAPRRDNATRQAMARTMTLAHAAVVPATVMDVAEIGSWYAPESDVMVRLARAVCAAVAAEPALNSWYDPERRFGSQPSGVHLGIAVDTDRGLYVPVISGVDRLEPAALRPAIDDAIDRVRNRRPAPPGDAGPTISLSNFGAIGGRHAVLVVTPPQVAILGAGRAYETVRWSGETPVRAVELPLSLTFDHRAATGGEAARFLAAVIADLQRGA